MKLSHRLYLGCLNKRKLALLHFHAHDLDYSDVDQIMRRCSRAIAYLWTRK